MGEQDLAEVFQTEGCLAPTAAELDGQLRPPEIDERGLRELFTYYGTAREPVGSFDPMLIPLELPAVGKKKPQKVRILDPGTNKSWGALQTIGC